MEVIRSPVLRPARAAGLPVVRLATNAPVGRFIPRLSAISGVTACRRAPSQGRLTALPPLLAEETTTRTILAGIAKPQPCQPPARQKIAGFVSASPPRLSPTPPPPVPAVPAPPARLKTF